MSIPVFKKDVTHERSVCKGTRLIHIYLGFIGLSKAVLNFSVSKIYFQILKEPYEINKPDEETKLSLFKIHLN